MSKDTVDITRINLFSSYVSDESIFVGLLFSFNKIFIQYTDFQPITQIGNGKYSNDEISLFTVCRFAEILGQYYINRILHE